MSRIMKIISAHLIERFYRLSKIYIQRVGQSPFQNFLSFSPNKILYKIEMNLASSRSSGVDRS
jgi:hypothetical protein